MSQFLEHYAQAWVDEHVERFRHEGCCEDCARRVARLTVEVEGLRAARDHLRQAEVQRPRPGLLARLLAR